MNEKKENFYPDLSNYNESFLKQKLEKLRLQNFENDLTFITDKINHYSKLLKKWKKVDTGVKYTNIGLTSLCTVGGLILLGVSTLGTGIIAITGVGIAGGFIVGGTPLFTNALQGVFNITLIKNRKKKYRKIVDELNKYKNELFLYHQKALKDEVLTDEEINMSKEIVDKAKNVILKIKDNNKLDDNNEEKESRSDNKKLLENFQSFLQDQKKLLKK
jgi:hypothetical protein